MPPALVSAASLSDGEIQVAGNLACMGPAVALWWTRDRATAHRVVQAIGEQRPGSVEAALAELHAAAARLETVLSEHSVVVARARTAIDQLSSRLSTAQRAGDLKFFNHAYRQYRLGCQQRGEGAMPYNVALATLRKLLAGAAAGSSIEGVVERVFAGRDVG